jgi:lipid-binding SYLF domain-containing protein
MAMAPKETFMRALSFRALAVALALVLPMLHATPVFAASASELNAESRKVLNKLVADVPAAKALNHKAIAVLVFPSITKAGFMIGGQYGEGVLYKGGKPVGYYSTGGASYGLQAGAQTYGYAMFFMTQKGLNALSAQKGFEVGVGPSVVVVDEGMAKTATTKTMTDDVYAFVFGQKGLMAGVGIQGNKITKIKK